MVKHSKWCVVLAVTVANCFGTPAIAGTIRHDRDDQLYLDLAQQPAYQSVGKITLEANDRSPHLASGSVIAPRWVLTAAHVVADTASLQFHLDGEVFNAKQWVAHPKFAKEPFYYDIGLVELDRETPVKPATRYAGSNELGKVGTFVGYGLTGNGLTGTDFDNLSFDKRAGQNVIDSPVYLSPGFGRGGAGVDWTVFTVDFDSPAAPDSDGPLDLEYLTTSGDSGGGVFIEEGGQPLLAGVHSWIVDDGDGLRADYGDYTGHTRVSIFNDWIDSIIAGKGGGRGGGGKGKLGGAMGNAIFSSSPYAAAVPEPGSLALLILAACTLLWHRQPGSAKQRLGCRPRCASPVQLETQA